MKNVLGKMGLTTVPRTPGRDFAGVVEQGPSEWIGRPVFGTGGDLGFRRDGSHAEYLAVPVEAVLVRPEGLGPAQAAALGSGLHDRLGGRGGRRRTPGRRNDPDHRA